MNRKSYTFLFGFLSSLILLFASMFFAFVQSAEAEPYHYIAHRGIVNAKYPGNTIEAFKQAASTKGIWGIETDLWRTKDGKWVCIHGESGTSATWAGMSVLTTDSTTLLSKKSPQGYALPTFEQYLDICKAGGKTAVIEMKDNRIMTNKEFSKEIVQIVRSKGMLKKCMFISSTYRRQSVANAKAWAKTLYNVDVYSDIIVDNSKEKIDNAIEYAKNLNLDGISVPVSLMEYALPKAKSSGLSVRGRGVDNELQGREVFQKYNPHAVTVEFSPVKYKVTFKDGVTGEVLKTQKVVYGGKATAPTPPSHDGYTFNKWNKTQTNITGTTIITAKYKAN